MREMSCRIKAQAGRLLCFLFLWQCRLSAGAEGAGSRIRNYSDTCLALVIPVGTVNIFPITTGGWCFDFLVRIINYTGTNSFASGSLFVFPCSNDVTKKVKRKTSPHLTFSRRRQSIIAQREAQLCFLRCQ